jgi:hypothetical protein
MSRSVIAALIAALAATPAAAVTVAPLSFEQLIHASSAVVYGRVTSVRAQWSEDRRHVESVVTVEVLKGLKGSAPEAMSFTVPGGQLGRYVNLIPGAPSFSEGDLAVVFLMARGPRLPVTTGFTQGIYRVRRGQAGELLVQPPAVTTGRIVRGDVNRKPVPLAAFESSVRAIASAAQ